MVKQLTFEGDAREAILRGVQKLAKAVISTLGPRGRNAVLDKGWGGPTITKDGVTVAEEIELQNGYENMGVKLVKEAASKTSDTAGDGTTTSTLLALGIVEEGIKFLTAGANHAQLIKGVRLATEALVGELSEMAKPVPGTDNKAIAQVAAIASNNDKVIGKIIADAMPSPRKSVFLGFFGFLDTPTSVWKVIYEKMRVVTSKVPDSWMTVPISARKYTKRSLKNSPNCPRR